MFNINGKSVNLRELVEEEFQSQYGQSVAQRTSELQSNPRQLGNSYFDQGVYTLAIYCYNMALMKCHDDAAEAALCYANRAACYLEMKFFKNCLHNLDLAAPYYPAEKIPKLLNRREKCLKMMSEESDAGQVELESPFDKLTYPANPKLPFFIDAIELKQDKAFGRHLITARDVKAGNVIALIDQPLRLREYQWKEWECANCMKKCHLDLIVSKDCEQGEVELG